MTGTWIKKIGLIITGLLFISEAFLMNAAMGQSGASLLTEQEREWLKVHDGKIKLAHSPDWPPMDFVDEDGNHQGMVADYIHLIEKKLDFKFNMIRIKNWEEILSLAKNQEIDVISAGEETKERKRFMTWSSAYLNLKTTIIVNKNIKGTLTLSQMQGMKIGVPRKYVVGELIRDKYPHLTLVDVCTSREGIRKVSFGELDAMITEVPNALYLIENEKITNLRLAGVTGFELTHGMGIRKDWPIFSRIIEKALAGISEKEHREIYARWIKLETNHFYETRTFWYVVFGAVSAIIIVIGFSVLWNRALKIQVMQRTEALRFNERGLEALLELNEQTHASVREIIEFSFRQMLRLTQSKLGYLAFEDQDGNLYVADTSDDKSKGHITTHSLSNGAAPDSTGFWSEALSKGRPFISNSFDSSSQFIKEINKKHKPLYRYMIVPIFSGGKAVVVAGMANKVSDYTSSDLKQLNLLAQGMWRLIQRKKAEQSIIKSEKRFQDLVENLPNGVAIIQDRSIVYKNPKLKELMGKLELFSPSGYERIHQDDQEKVKEFYLQISRKELVTPELSFRFYPTSARDDQSAMRWVNCIATPMDYQDRSAFLVIAIDMTEAKKLERLLTIQDKMASLGHVSAGIAHEIRNPLSGINIYIRTIEKNYEKPEKKRKIISSIEAIRSASKKMESVIKRVMNFAKPLDPKFDLIDINMPIREAVKLTGFTLEKKGISTILSLDEGLPLCYAEPHLIEEVILNLINNAADAIMQKKRGGWVRLTSTVKKDTIIISVEDNGPGISRELRERIFEPFFTTKEYSTGIGLSLCHRIITDHKAEMKAIPSELGGAKFMIRIPVSKESPAGSLND